MHIRPKIYVSLLDDPFKNLSIENQLLLNIGVDERILFLYVNRPSVVLGRFQNPWLECNLKKMKEKNITLVRRQSGGGCVFHDKGNLNFSFLYPLKDFHKDINNSLIIKALNVFDINAYASGRSDLLVDSSIVKKFSGSAFKQKKDRSFHHGTLLIDSNLTELNKYLLAKKLDLVDSKSIKSNPATVINLNSLNSKVSINTLTLELKKAVEAHYDQSVSIEEIDNFTPCDYYHSLVDWNWRWGETPLFITRFENYNLSIKKGKLMNIDQDEINDQLQGIELKQDVLLHKRMTCDNDRVNKVLDYLIDLVIE